MTVFPKILVPTDFSAGASRALEYAAELARAFGAKIEVIHVLTPHAADPVKAEKELPKVGAGTCDDVITSRELVRAMQPELGIIHEARTRGADLVVIGTHGRTGLKHVLLGSVAERVVQLADCPVLTVRPADHAFERP